MKIETPFQAASLIAVAIVTVVTIILLIITLSWNTSLQWWTWLIFIITSFSVAYGMSYWAIQKFIHGKIMTLYRVILSPDNLNKGVRSALKSKDTLGVVQEDVKNWVSVKQSEIQTLKEQAKFRRDFVGNLAHELRTPIFNMQGYLQTLIEGGLEDPKINYDYLDRADKNLERLITLVEDLDGISRLESGEKVLKKEKFNINELVKEVFSLFELRTKEKGIMLRFNKKYEKPFFVMGDRSKIQQVITNLIANAIQYGKETGYCEVRFFDMSESLLIEVADDGIGIPANHLPRLFERFYRVDKSRSRHEGGTGLGLAICKHIIESHGQTISARSVEEKGTTFSFTLDKAK
ncbi:MAG: ATP-binding protein [Salibacteraceae bacterium]